jgi:hypothetical protein
VGLEQDPLSLVSTIEELLERKSFGSGLESREYGSRDPSRLPRGTLYSQKLALTSPTRGGRSVDIVRSRIQATVFSLVLIAITTLITAYKPYVFHCTNDSCCDAYSTTSPALADE